MTLLRKYGVEATVDFPIPKVNDTDFAATGDWTPATGDTKVSKDGGNFANTSNNPAAVGGTGSVGWTLTLTATEMQAARVAVQIVDAAVENQFIVIETYGNASAQHAVDLDDGVRAGLTALPGAAAGAAGGLGKSTNGIDLDNLPTATYLVQLIALLARKDAAIATDLSAALALINADFGSGAGGYANTTDSQEAIGDAAIGIAADLPQRITKNTALAKFPFKMVDSTDHITAETGLTVTATRSLDGAAFGACANSAAEIGSGWYYIDLAASDLNGNTVVLKFTATGADTREITIITQPT